MALFNTLIGASMGAGLRMWSNLMGRERLLARPWNYLVSVGFCGYCGYKWNDWGDQLQQAVNEKKMERGMLPTTRKVTPTEY